MAISAGGVALSALAISVVVFAVLMGSALLGSFLKAALPEHHLSDESKDIVKVGIGLLVTLSALVLGLLVASAKSSLDTKSEEIQQAAAKIILLDRTLRQFGSEADPARNRLREFLTSKVDLAWVKGDARTPGSDAATGRPIIQGIEEFQALLTALSPITDTQRLLRARALQLSDDLAQTRWLLIEQSGSSIPTPFLVVLVFWLAMIAACLGVFAPRNATVMAVSLVCTLSVASAIFLILELDRPFEGLMRISDAPLRIAIIRLNQ
jgi:hypothetical protein